MVPWNFLKFLWGVGCWRWEVEKLDLRLWNSVYVLTATKPLCGLVGDGWGQRHSNPVRLLASLFSPILCKLDVSMREIALGDT